MNTPYGINMNVPSEIIEAARKVENWMQSQGRTKWKLMGIQSREDSYPPEITACTDCEKNTPESGLVCDEYKLNALND